MQPIQIAQAISNTSSYDEKLMTSLDNLDLDVQQESETRFIITVGNMTATIDVIANGHRVSTVIDGKTLTYDITTEIRPTSDSAIGKAPQNSERVQQVVLVNGTEIDTSSLDKIAQSQSIGLPYELPQTRGDNFWYDGSVYYVDSYQTPYAHPDRVYYNATGNPISPYSNWYIIGEDLVHYQYSYATSHIIYYGGAFVAGFTMGASIGSVFGKEASAVVGLIGGILTLITGSVQHEWLDEDGCLWFWFDKYTPGWLEGWLEGLSPHFNLWFGLELLGYWDLVGMWEIAQGTYFYETLGYYRLGSHTYFNGLGINDPGPPPPHTDISTIVQYPGYGNGYVDNPWGARYSPPDNNLALIYGINANAGGQIVGKMSDVSKGNIYVYAASVHGYNTRLYVYVSNDNQQWYPAPIPSQVVQGGTGWHWVHFGNQNSNFQYIGICAINNQGQPVNIYIDSAIVTPY